MKRFFIFAAMAIAAVSCQKTEVQNEVLTKIGFDTEAGKQTRAIVTGTTLPANSFFGVHAYLHDSNNSEKPSSKLMDDQIVNAAGNTVSSMAEDAPAVTYYWPNDPNNTIDFYAYYPKSVAAAMATEGTLTLTLDNSTNYWGDAAVDFMVATPVKNAKYSTNQGKVAVDFKHQLTQVKFTVQVPTTGEYTLKSIKLNGVTTQATYTNKFDTAPTWTVPTTANEVVAYPLTETEKAYPTGTVTTTAMLMIPATATTFDLEYTVLSNGVTETVKHNIAVPAANAWTANHSITYTIALAGAQVISFTPTVTGWQTVTPETINK